MSYPVIQAVFMVLFFVWFFRAVNTMRYARPSSYKPGLHMIGITSLATAGASVYEGGLSSMALIMMPFFVFGVVDLARANKFRKRRVEMIQGLGIEVLDIERVREEHNG